MRTGIGKQRKSDRGNRGGRGKIDREAEALKAENAKLKDDYLRAYAELENTKKRCAAEMEKNSKYAVSSFAKEILSVADNLHRALAAAEELSGSECEQLKKAWN